MSTKPNTYIVDQNLYDWLMARDDHDLPVVASGTPNYKKRFTDAIEKVEPIYDKVETGALLTDINKLVEEGKISADQVSYLNNHGFSHIKTVIARASDLLIGSNCKINAYEGYLLLMAILFHDVGNILGREGHEKHCWTIMNGMGDRIGIDNAEKRAIIKIASVHGGNIHGDKDTISKLEERVDLMGQRGVRKQFLAAILRFADELADDSSRSATFIGGNIDIIPSSSKIYHEYSSCLHSVTIDKNVINLSFELYEKHILDKYEKGKEEVFLIDEIYYRTNKMHNERLYTMRFMRPDIEINKIKVLIKIYQGDAVLKSEKITYTLEEKGYPTLGEIFDLCPDLIEKTGEKIKAEMEKAGSE